jgi:two-component system OmpR family sensor kinase
MFNSIRTRLTFWFTGVLALILIAFAVSTYLFLDYTIRRQTDNTLQQIAGSLAAAVNNEQADSGESDAPQNTEYLNAIQEAMGDLRFRNYTIFVSDAHGDITSTDNQTAGNSSLSTEQMTKLARDFSSSAKQSALLQVRGETDFRVFARKNAIDGRQFNVFVAHALDDEEMIVSRFRDILLISVPLVLIFAGFGGYFLARKTLSPVAEMSDSAATISATNLNERLPVKNEKDELGGLASVFNSLLGRLENSFENQRRFMADASHELRTPLAIVRGESEVALSKDNRTPAEYQESLAIVHDESKRLTRIVEDLFTLARADSGQYQARKTEMYLDELLTDCIHKVRVLAEKRKVSLNLSTLEEMPMRGDEQLLRRLFMNLLDNAIKYNREGGQVFVRGEKTADFYRITIADTGAGIPKEDETKIFERFYRADKARSRASETATSGAGLGLSIAQWIAELHQGKIELVSSSETGSIFAVVFTRN